MTKDITDFQNAEYIDLREVTNRVEELEAQHDGGTLDEEETEELADLSSLLDDLRSNGGDHDWRGAWYPISLIADYYWETYAREFAEDIGAVKDDAGWPNQHIDWKAAAESLQQDYSSVEFKGKTFWYR